ncbi:MAG: hypothetical protein WCJ24_03560, partial [Candidatus Saccharibacteria bacterium]
MISDLRNMQHPMRLRILWVLVYLTIAGLVFSGVYAAADRVKTHTLPVGQVQLAIPYSKYLVNEAVSFTITNKYNSPVYVLNNCPGEPLAVYRQEGGKWVRVHDQASVSDCPLEKRQVSVPANGVVNGTFAPWHNLFTKPGKYRVVAFVEFYNALPYQEFEVISAPPPAAPPAASSPTSKPSSPAVTSKTTSDISTNSPRTTYLATDPAPTTVK